MFITNKKGIDECSLRIYTRFVSNKLGGFDTDFVEKNTNFYEGEEQNMSEKEKQILETFEKVLPDLNEMEKEKLLSFGEGMAFMKERQKKESTMALAGQANAM